MFTKSIISAMAVVCVISLASNAQAVTFQYADTTVGGPTWNRPVAGNPPVAPLSGVGTAVAYHEFSFQVDVAGSYDFLSEAIAPENWDNYLFLYQSNFNPLDQFADVIIGNDDFPAIGRSGFNGVNLSTNTTYVLVTSGFGNDDAGTFNNTITGPGNVQRDLAVAVPEPLTGSLLGMALATTLMRRRR